MKLDNKNGNKDTKTLKGTNAKAKAFENKERNGYTA